MDGQLIRGTAVAFDAIAKGFRRNMGSRACY